MAREVWLASVLTSAATTANPFPASPARAASIVAFERQEVGLRSNRRDGSHHRADALGRVVQRTDDGLGAFGIGNRGLCHPEPVGGLLADLLDGTGQFLCRGDG